MIYQFQECIKPVKYEKSTTSSTGSKIKIEDDRYTQLNEPKLKKVEISLSDCLACSGCITSAESVLVTSQSQEELLRLVFYWFIYHTIMDFMISMCVLEFLMKIKVTNLKVIRNSLLYLFQFNLFYHWPFFMGYHLS